MYLSFLPRICVFEMRLSFPSMFVGSDPLPTEDSRYCEDQIARLLVLNSLRTMNQHSVLFLE